MSSNLPVPSEDEEQLAFCDYLRMRHIMFYHPPAEMFSSSWKQKARNKAMGATKGFPDLIIPLTNCGRLVCIEMKRTKGGVVAPEQWEWNEALNKCGVHSFIAYGAEMAIALIEYVESLPKLDHTQRVYENKITQDTINDLYKKRKKSEEIF